MQLPTFYLDRFRQLYDFPGDSFPSARKLRLVFDNKQWTGPVVESPTLRRRTSSFVNFPFCLHFVPISSYEAVPRALTKRRRLPIDSTRETFHSYI